MQRAHILIAEKELIPGQQLDSLLRKRRYDVVGIVSSGEALLEAAEKLRPDLIIISLPLSGKINGIETTRILRSRFGIPVINLASRQDKASLEKAKEVNPFNCVMKPFEENDLYATLEITLYKHSLEKDLRIDYDRTPESIEADAAKLEETLIKKIKQGVNNDSLRQPVSGQNEQNYIVPNSAEEIMEAIVDGIGVTDAKGMILQANRAVIELYGYMSMSELIGKPFTAFITEDEIMRCIRRMKEMRRSKEKFIRNWETVGLTKDGREFPVMMNVTAFENKEGKAIGYIFVVRDITELKQTREEIKKDPVSDDDVNEEKETAGAKEYNKMIIRQYIKAGQKQVQEIIDVVNDGIAIIGLDGIIQKTNNVFSSLFDYKTPQNIIGKPFENCIAKEEFKNLKEELKNFIKRLGGEKERSNKVIRNLQTHCVTRDGKKFPVSIDVTGRFNEEDKPAGYIFVLRELAGLKATEKKNKDKIDEISKEIKKKLEEKDREHNKRIEKMEADTLRKLEEKDRDLNRRIAEAEADTLRKLEEKDRDLNSKLAETEKALGDNLKDMEDLKKNHTEMLIHMINAQKTASTGFLIGETAVRLNTELTDRIDNITKQYIAIEESDKNPENHLPELKRFIEMITEETLQCREKTENLQIYARIDDEKRSMEINEIIENVLKLTGNLFKSGKITFKKDFSGDIEKVNVNKKSIEEVFLNILSNAEKAMPDGGEIEINTMMSRDGKLVETWISDKSSGMSKEELKSLIEPFYEKKRVVSDPNTVNIIDIAICRKLLNEHGGFLEIESAEKGGTTYIIKLPVQK